ncbi:MFS transporter [Novosphingobium sp.]|uniref:MFS transporter n=1 Tax=Novosphingobium sp. TaxID=1874826 RepID=UPI002FDA4441
MQPEMHAVPHRPLRHRGPIVLGGVLFARLFINHPIIVQTFAALLVPLALDMHADRGSLSLALAGHLFCLGLVSPIYGYLIDRYGVRRVLVPCLFLTGLLLIGVSAAPSLEVIIVLYLAMGLVGAAAAPTAWGKIVTSVIHKRRGLALSSLSTTGGIGGALMPMAAAALIAAVGWRATYVCLGVMMILGTVPILLAVTPRTVPQPAGAKTSSGSSFKRILARRQFWAMVISGAAIGVSGSGLAVHYIPMLLDRGMTLEQATAFNALPNLVLVVTALLFGYFLDRTRPVLAGIALSYLSAFGFLLLAFGEGMTVIVGAAIAGCGGGAEVGLIAYLCTRYFASEDFGKVYGLAFFFWVVSQSVGAAAFGYGYTVTGDYLAPLLASVAILVLAPLALTQLGPYLFHGSGNSSADDSLSKGSGDKACN